MSPADFNDLTPPPEVIKQMAGPMFYVAEDPQQPGAAFASCVDRPEFAGATAKDVANWIKRGATIHRVNRETMHKMISAWKRP
jgi:hypothetical protein